MRIVRATSVEDVQREVQDALRANALAAPANGSRAAAEPGTETGQGPTARTRTGTETAIAVGSPSARRRRRVRPVGGRTKTALVVTRHDDHNGGDEGGSDWSDDLVIDMSGLTGVRDYRPAECTFTAWAGTKVAEVEVMLAADGLYLPFEPPFSRQGATLGGTVAAGLSGAGRFRYGGVRDFLLGARFVDGEGRVVRGGGQVVKNAAGFYLQHLQLGSLGRLGVLVELTFKVFPKAPAHLTLVADCATRDRAIDALVRLRQSTFEIEALELVPPATLWIRLGGTASAIEARAAALIAFLAVDDVRTLAAGEADELWAQEREFPWTGASALVKVPIAPSKIARLDDRLGSREDGGARRYGAGGEVAWIAWPGPIEALDRLLRELALPGLVLTRGATSVGGGPTDGPPIGATAIDPASIDPASIDPASIDPASIDARPCGASPLDPLMGDPLIGVRPDHVFLERVRAALDPHGLFA